MRALYCIWAGMALVCATAAAQTPAVTLAPTEYTVFVGGVPIGREDVLIRSAADGTTIVTRGRTAAPVNTVLDHVEFRYRPDGSPESFALEGTVQGAEVQLRTEFKDGSAISVGTRAGDGISISRTVSPRSIMIPNGIFGGFAALAARLSGASPGDEFPLFLLPDIEVSAELTAVRPDRMQTGTSTFAIRRYDFLLREPKGTLVVIVTTDTDGALLRVSVPERSIEVLRSDLASVSSRVEVFSNPGDRHVVVPAPGFNLAATITMPKGASDTPVEGLRHPAVVIVPGQNAPDRDTVVRGVPVMAQLAGALADAGFLVARYDRRGSGQSGGRAESSALGDYAQDVRTVVRWLARRDDVDRNRIAVVGHAQSAWVAMLAAAREDRVSALVTLAAAGTRGREMILEQQRRQLDLLNATEEERDSHIALQEQIHEAVLTARGWDQLPADLRQQADTPWFESLLEYDPAKVMNDVDVPVLIVHGDADREMPIEHAERLARLAQEGDAESIELIVARGVTHLLTPAVGAGDNPEAPARLAIDRALATAVTDWLTRTLPEPPARR